MDDQDSGPKADDGDQSAHFPPEETFEISFGQAICLGIYSGLLGTAMISVVIDCLFLLIILAGVLGGMGTLPANLGELGQAIKRIGFFFAFSFAFVGIVGFPTGFFGTLFTRRRCIQVINGEIVATTRWRRVAIPLDECNWSISSTCMDGSTFFSLARPSIIVKSEKQFLVCGFTDKAFQMWQLFLNRTIGPVTPKHNWQRNIRPAILHLIILGSLGWSAGIFAQALGGPPMWTGMATFLGILDGLVSGGFVLLRGHPKAERIGQSTHPVLFALFFGVLGAMVVRGLGFVPLVIVVVANSAVGALLGFGHRRQFLVVETSPAVDDREVQDC